MHLYPDTTVHMEPIPTICKGRVDNRDMSGARSTSLTSARNNFKQAINRRNLVAVITSRPPYVIPFFCKPNPTGHFVTTSKTGAQQLAGCNQVDVLPTRLLRKSVLPERATLFSGRLQNCYVPRDAASIRIKSIPTRCDGAVQLSRAHHAASTQNDNNYSFSTPVYLGNFKASVTPQHVLFTAGGWHALYGEWFCGCFVNNIKPVPGEMRPNGKPLIATNSVGFVHYYMLTTAVVVLLLTLVVVVICFVVVVMGR